MRQEEKLVTAPLAEPVTLDEMKAFARVGGDAEDAVLASLITAARMWCEAYTRRVFMRQRHELIVHEKPAGRVIELPKAPLAEVVSVHFEYDAGQSDLWPLDNVVVQTGVMPGRIVLREHAGWPFLYGVEAQLRIDYWAGYGSAADVPEPIKLAIKQVALHWFENRDLGVQGEMVGRLPLMAEALLSEYRIPHVR